MDCSTDNDELPVTDGELIDDLEHVLHKLARSKLIQLHSRHFEPDRRTTPRSQGSAEHNQKLLERWHKFVASMHELLANLEYTRALQLLLPGDYKVLRVLVRYRCPAIDLDMFRDRDPHGHRCDCRKERVVPRVPVILRHLRAKVPWQIKVMNSRTQECDWLTLGTWPDDTVSFKTPGRYKVFIRPYFTPAHHAAAWLYKSIGPSAHVWHLVQQYATSKGRRATSRDVLSGKHIRWPVIARNDSFAPLKQGLIGVRVKPSCGNKEFHYIFPRMRWSGSKLLYGVDMHDQRQEEAFKEVSPDYEYDVHDISPDAPDSEWRFVWEWEWKKLV